ncbi:MAG: S8 family serine peptidase [Bacteroidota bacterium]|nr:S8 family serine peptidase [Bacteroidota bacterium]
MNIGINFLKNILIVIFSFTIFSFLGSNNFNNQYKLSKRVMSELSTKPDNEKILVWIVFTDKGNDVSLRLSNPTSFLTQRAIERRMKVKPSNAIVDYTDLPLNHKYVDEIKNSGIEIKNKSKWFNRVSCYANKIQIEQIINNNFVSKIDMVGTFKKNPNDFEIKKNYETTEEDNNGNQNNILYQLNYGNSLDQMEIINAPVAHDSGYKGQGVLIASFDTGFDNLQHPVFDSIRVRGLRTYDFVNGDTNVANENGQMGEGSHGTMTLSLVGGYKPGELISPAFRSQYILAKTENTDSETPLEEDNWIAAAEWADSLGADIITSSLGYLNMDPGSIRSYDWTWMNGDSCVITIGADLAVNKGIIVCNSAGNQGFHDTHNTLGAPSDGDSVICVGSCNLNKNRSSFSSVGLSVDGRIKPDVVALGNGNHVAAPGAGNTGYTSGGGTSFSCPMTAGVCAVILSANNNLTPMQVRQLLIQTADSTFAPNRRRGWGLINCWEAVKLALPKTLNLTSLIEGRYDEQTNTIPGDTVKVYLRTTISPFPIVDLAKVNLNSSGTALITFNEAENGINYYLQFKHRNSLETWSKSGQSFPANSTLIYNFTTDSAKAFGNNLKKVGVKWVIYTGDVNQDGSVDISDLAMIDNDAGNFASGYIDTDLNGDNFADIADLSLADNNAANFVTVMRP